ncbi:MAG: SH3 domain-containing protein, partial [Eubacteriales bacterium]|nr:SH3 domain-containing protein [Eubacteriales bacterium]
MISRIRTKVRQSKIVPRLAVLALALALVIGQIGPFRGRDLDVEALTFVRQWMYISGTDVRVRSGPSTSHTILDYLNTGHRVYVWTTERGSDLDWYLVTYVSGNYPRTGYVAAKYVKPLDTDTNSAFEAAL